jgi:hypothetical protein
MLRGFGLAVRIVGLFGLALGLVGCCLDALWLALWTVGVVGPVNIWILPLSALGATALLAYGYRIARAHGADPWGTSSPRGDIH